MLGTGHLITMVQGVVVVPAPAPAPALLGPAPAPVGVQRVALCAAPAAVTVEPAVHVAQLARRVHVLKQGHSCKYF